MQIVNRNNKTYLSFRNEFGKVEPFQMQIYAKSGMGKGLSSEFIIEEWQKATKGIVLTIADPKNEAEFSYVSVPPEERYHLERLKLDGIIPKTYPSKLYHPFTFNIPKGYLPDINFFTIPIKNMTREDWSILAESSWDSEAIKLLIRVSKDLGRKEGLFKFLHEVQDLVKGKKDRKNNTPDPRNFYLSVGSGTAKSITEIAGLLSPFKEDYFLRKQSCEKALNWQEILTDNENYHVFLSMWLKDEKQRHFMVLHLLRQIIENRHFAKKPILIVIPEIRVLCPRNPQGYKLFLSEAITNSLSTMRSQGRGISSLADGQNWMDTDDGLKGSATITLIGELSTKDQEVFSKAMNYKREHREQIQNMEYRNSYLIAGRESEGAFRIFLPSHGHKEPHYNWIETYRKYFGDKMKRYDNLVKFMREEYNAEEKEIKEIVGKIIQEQIEEQKEKNKTKEEKETKKSEKPKVEDKNTETMVKLCFEMYHDESFPKSERSYRKIGDKLNLHHVTVKKYIKKFSEKPKVEEFPDIESINKEVEGVDG